jgi:phosphotransferase system enzyme I (PtsI)
MSAVTVPAVKARVTETDTEDAAALAADALACSTREEVRALLELD